MSKIFLKILFVKKVSGRVQEGPRSPPDSLEKYSFARKSLLYVLTYFLLPIVLPIELLIVFAEAIVLDARLLIDK